MAVAQSAPASNPDAAKNALIYPFVSATDPPPPVPTPSNAACPARPVPELASDASAPDKTAPAVVVDPKLTAAISAELQKKLSKRFITQIATAQPAGKPADPPAPRTLIVSGCITTADSGNAVERMAGFRLGASHLNAHVVVQVQTAGSAPRTLTEFDVKVQGSNLLPPLGPVGLVTHAAMSGRKTLTADAKKLADEILKTFAEKMKAAKAHPAAGDESSASGAKTQGAIGL